MPQNRSSSRYLAASLVGVLACLGLLGACQQEQEQEHNATLFVFGTIVEIKLWGASQQQSDSAFSEIQQMFQGMHRDWHAWEPGLLVEINEAFAKGAAVTANQDIVEMIRLSQQVEEKSGGSFNPAIGGFGTPRPGSAYTVQLKNAPTGATAVVLTGASLDGSPGSPGSVR